MKTLICLISIVIALTSARPARADVEVFVNRYLDWLIATQHQIRVIDFETLPDGRRSFGGEPITPQFNYTHMGVTFSPLLGADWFGIAGNQQSGFSIRAISHYPPFRAAIAADLVVPTPAVAAFFPGHTTLSVFDRNGTLLASQFFSSAGCCSFIGFVSTVPIARMVADSGGPSEDVEDFLFVPIPEPSTAAMLFLGAGALLATRRLRRARVTVPRTAP